MSFAIRYQPGSDLARRWPEHAGGWATRAEAEMVRSACANCDRMEIVEVEK